MAVFEFGYTSKVYPFGSVPGKNGALPDALPTKMLVSASYYAAPGETVKIMVTLGKVVSTLQQYVTVLQDTGGVPSVSLLDTEVDVTSYVPATLAGWSVIIKASITADENTEPEYNASEPVELYCYYDVLAKKSIVRVGPNNVIGVPQSGIVAAGTGPSPYADSALFKPISGAQIMFYAKDTNLSFATVISDRNGKATALVPPGSYDVRLYGGGFLEQDWLVGNKALSVGSSDLVTRFGSSADDIAQKSEFNVIKAHFASTKWIGYFIPEDFTTPRNGFRNESADATNIYGHLANQEFGRIFRGASYIDYIGVAFDPPPI